MNALGSNIKIYGLMLGCMMCGAMLADILDSLIHGRFSSFYASHPVQFWLTIPINAGVILLLIRRADRVVRDRRESTGPREKAGVGPSLAGVSFHTTPFIRICLYVGFYILGVALVFLF